MKNQLVRTFCASVFLSLLASTAEAAVISYDESIDGDIDQNNGGYLGSLSAGVNTVAGTTTWTTSITDFDTFTFSIPAGYTVSAFSVNSIFTAVDGTGFLNIGQKLVDNSNSLGNTYGTWDLGTNQPTEIDIFGQIGISSLVAGEYLTGTNGAGRNTGGVIEYEYSITVSAVPIPAAAWLFGSGLIGLVGLARRKKA